MKWYAVLPLIAVAAMPGRVSAQEIRTVAIGKIMPVDDRAPSLWGMSGMEIFRVTQTVGSFTPIMRTETMDARTVEILSRTQAPPLRASDVATVSKNGKHYITVRRYLLFEVTPQDARAEGTNPASLARKWATNVRRVLPQVAPTPNRFGV
jgi:hypothetical protein